MRRLVIYFLVLLVAAVAWTPADVKPTSHTVRGRFAISVKAIVNPVDGEPSVLCQLAEISGPHEKSSWWIGFGEADATRKCGASEDPPSDADNIYFLSRVSVSVKPTAEGPLVVRVSFSSRRLLAEEPPEESREFSLWPQDDRVVIPLMLASAGEQEALGIRELYLELEVKVLGQDSSPYGELRVRSSMVDAELRLDGGVVGKVTKGEETLLSNVRAGLRELQARDKQGLISRTVVRVLPGYTVVAELAPTRAESQRGAFGLASMGKNSQGYQQFRRTRDGAVVVEIPGGEFVMGNPKTERQPLEHKVHVSTFLMDRTGVTWGQYKQYSASSGIPLPPEPYWGIHDDHPVVFVTWDEGRAYCEWAGARLPTEAEREKAARSTDKRMFPWGEEEPNPELGVFRRSWGFEATDPVGSHPAGISPYGLLDMGGNVWEWCSDWYDKDYYTVSPYRDPQGPATGIAHVVRGGSWDSRPTVLSCSCRSFGQAGYREGDFGFRCAMDPPVQPKIAEE